MSLAVKGLIWFSYAYFECILYTYVYIYIYILYVYRNRHKQRERERAFYKGVLGVA